MRRSVIASAAKQSSSVIPASEPGYRLSILDPVVKPRDDKSGLLRHLWLLAMTAILFHPTIICAQEMARVPESSYILQADEIYGIDNTSFTAMGNVRVSFRNSTITADTTIYHPETETIEAIGNITVKDDMQELKADRVIYYLNTETGIIDNASGVFNGEYYVCAENLERVGKEYYLMEGVRITTCSSPLPDWSFSFKKATAQIDGYLLGDHATANILDMPVFYSPKMLYPLKFTRQTGFLIPFAGYDSDMGMFYQQNFFWAMDIDKDLTIGINAFSERGLQGVSEFRYAISPDSRIQLTAEGLNDSDSTVYTSGRWRYTSSSIVSLPYNFEAILDTDAVSDYMYMRDFEDYTTYDRKYPNRENVFHHYYQLGWRSKWLDAAIRYQDDSKLNDETRQTSPGWWETGVTSMPSVSIRKDNLRLGIVNVDYYADWQQVQSRYNQYYFDNDTIKDVNDYNRYHGEGSIYRSFRFPFMQITPSAKLYYTRWEDAIFDEDNITIDRVSSFTNLRRSGNGYERVVPELSVKANFNQIYKYYGKNRHSIMNTFEYVFVEEINQFGLPDHFVSDRLDNKSEINWQIRSYYSSDNWTTQFSAKQGIAFHTINDKPLSPMEITALVSRVKWFTYSMNMELDFYGGNEYYGTIAYLNSFLSIPISPVTIFGGYTYDGELTSDNMNNTNTDVTAGIAVNIKNVLLSASSNWAGMNNILSAKRLRPKSNRITAGWQAQCWTAGLLFEWERRMDNTFRSQGEVKETTVGLTLTLRGLGDSELGLFNRIEPYD